MANRYQGRAIDDPKQRKVIDKRGSVTERGTIDWNRNRPQPSAPRLLTKEELASTGRTTNARKSG